MTLNNGSVALKPSQSLALLPSNGTPKRLSESTAVSLGLAALMGVVVAVVVYPPSFLMGEAARFHSFDPPNDAVVHRMAWQALVYRGYPWPSLWTKLFNYPLGAPISLMDGLPLAATVFRPFVSWLPPGFHYFGFWHAVAIILQSVAGAVFIRAAGVRHVIPCVLAAAVALSMPIFVGRLNWANVALATQGLLLFALAVCVHVLRERHSARFVFPKAAVLSLVSLAVHPLLALQVLLFCLLAIVLSNATALRRVGAAAILCLCFVALCQALGIFSAESFGSQLGLGQFGFSPVGMIFGEPDSLREIYGAQDRGIEQDAWLGAGCVLLLLIGLVVPPRFHVPKAYYPLAAAIALLAILAVSPWVRIGTAILNLSFLLPEAVIELYAVHRATVRLAWPLVMCLSLLGLAHFIVKWPRGRAVLVLGVAFVLQIYSAWPYWAHEFRYARAEVVRLPPIPAILENGSFLVFRDAPVDESEQSRVETVNLLHHLYAMHLAVESGLPLKGGRFARPPAAESADSDLDSQRPLGSGARYLAPAPTSPDGSDPYPQVSESETCVQWEILMVCAEAQEHD